MSTSSEENFAYINYYLRRRYYNHVISYCDLKLKSSFSDHHLILWKAIALILNGILNLNTGNPTLAIQELTPMEDKRDFSLVWHYAMLFAHRSYTEAVANLEAKFTISMANTNLSEKSYHLAGLFCLHTGDREQAITHFKNSLTKNANFIPAMIGMGWIEVQDSESTTWFSEVMAKSMQDPDAILGQSIVLRTQKKTPQALDLINRLIAYYPSFVPALVERLYILFEMLSWDALLEAAQRLTGISNDDVDALTIISWYELCWEGPTDNAILYLNIARKALEKVEPNNGDAMLEMCKPFVRISSKNPKILHECEIMLQNAIRVNPKDPKYYVELGKVALLQGENGKAKDAFEKASKLDSQNMEALEGIISCLIAAKQYKSAEHQLEMFTELQKSFGLSSSLSFMNGMICLNHLDRAERWLGYIKDALETQLNKVQGKRIGFSYYVSFNPQFVLDIIGNYIENYDKRILPEEQADHFHMLIRDVLEIILRIFPGSTESLYFLAKVELMLGDTALAETHLQKAIAKSKTDLKAYMLLSEVHLGNNNFKGALSALDMALSFDFSIRQDPHFLLIKAKCLNGNGQFNDALAVLKTAFNLNSVKESIAAKGVTLQSGPSKIEVAQLYLNLVESQEASGNLEDAFTTMNTSVKLFKNTQFESLFILANARGLIKKNDSTKALELLSSIKPEQSGYLQAKSLMANIYLNVMKDRKKYTLCFKEVVEKRPTIESCILLGEAFLKIQEPLEAINAYNSALKTYPTETVFITKIGDAYFKAHHYEEAVEYYKSALNESIEEENRLQIYHELVSILVKLKMYDDATQQIGKALTLASAKGPCLMEAKLKILNGHLMSNYRRYTDALSSFSDAKDLLHRLLIQEAGKESKYIEKEILNVCLEMGLIEEKESKNLHRAESLYSEALQIIPDNEKATIFLAKLYINQANHSAAQALLNAFMEKNPGVEEASIIMGDLLYSKASFQAALFHYRHIFEKNRTNYEVLAKIVDISTRICKLDGIRQYFAPAKANQNFKVNMGYHFCKGLYLRATSSHNDAIKELALCRKDAIWGERALVQLIEILLNSTHNTIGGGALEDATDKSYQTDNSADFAEVITADRLIMVSKSSLQELKEPKSLRIRLVECQVLMARKQKADIERAITIMLEILKTNPDYIPAIYGTSVGFMLLKQYPKARNQLKRISKIEWTHELGADIEKCWILLADVYIQGGKYDLATELLKKVTDVNQSLVKAWEYLGFIMEKEQAFKDAAEYYFKCWNLERHSNPPIGFKLAYNYLKAKRYTDAIDICHQVLAVKPDYPKIRSEILDKSRSLLR